MGTPRVRLLPPTSERLTHSFPYDTGLTLTLKGSFDKTEGQAGLGIPLGKCSWARYKWCFSSWALHGAAPLAGGLPAPRVLSATGTQHDATTEPQGWRKQAPPAPGRDRDRDKGRDSGRGQPCPEHAAGRSPCPALPAGPAPRAGAGWLIRLPMNDSYGFLHC